MIDIWQMFFKLVKIGKNRTPILVPKSNMYDCFTRAGAARRFLAGETHAVPYTYAALHSTARDPQRTQKHAAKVSSPRQKN